MRRQDPIPRLEMEGSILPQGPTQYLVRREGVIEPFHIRHGPSDNDLFAAGTASM
jgi:hypothetical protein